ncbi:MAG: acyl transferase [Bacteroidetes bacterium]|nr:MAG: acyl transferase [Bacteroidota bacterium]
MPLSKSIENNIWSIKNESDFNTTALEVFYFQYTNNSIYRKWVDYLAIEPRKIANYREIPFLPISLFKTHQIKSFLEKEEIIFNSSGTTGINTSKHYVFKTDLYRKSYRKAFEYFYGDIKEYTILALLPSYLEREGSSLIYMTEDLIQLSANEKSGFYLYNYDELFLILSELKKDNKKVLLLGVSFALLEFAENYKLDFPDLIVMETGGMKGKRKELLRTELHSILCNAFGVDKIHSEYGMTELLSQAYSLGNSVFNAPPWMKILIRDTNDPLSLKQKNKSGGVNVIDLCNLYSCSFIATQDLGHINNDNSFEILGRFDNSDIRGCNLLVL